MAFTKKTWKDRITEFPTRRTLTKSDGSTELVTVARAEGTVSQEGDAFNAASMNDLEERISQANNDLNESLSIKSITATLIPGSTDWVQVPLEKDFLKKYHVIAATYLPETNKVFITNFVNDTQQFEAIVLNDIFYARSTKGNGISITMYYEKK